MKYVKLSSILVALFFAVGCGSKTVDSKGGVTKDTVEQKAPTPGDESTNGAESKNGSGYPEGGFMGDNSGSGDEDGNYGGANAGKEGMQNNGSDNAYNTDGQNPSTQDGTANGGIADGDGYGTNNELTLNSLTTIYFDFDKYDIRQDMKDYVRANADYIKQHNIKSIVLQGNTDEFGGDEYNMALGQKRALAVKNALVSQGLPKNMFKTISFGAHKPVCKEKTTDCYAKNRRTDLVEK